MRYDLVVSRRYINNGAPESSGAGDSIGKGCEVIGSSIAYSAEARYADLTRSDGIEIATPGNRKICAGVPSGSSARSLTSGEQ